MMRVTRAVVVCILGLLSACNCSLIHALFTNKNTLDLGVPSMKSRLVTAPSPITLNLTRVEFTKSTNTSSSRLTRPSGRQFRSKPGLFSKALGLLPGTPFVFSFDRWRMLQRCGLFSNLNLVVRKSNTTLADSSVVLEISGEELPSLKFSPEISFEASLERPEVSGGISIVDRNFMGLAHKLEFLISKKEGKEKGTADLHPYFLVKWTDSGLGSSSRCSISLEEDHSIEESGDLLYRGRPSADRQQVMCKRLGALFSGSFQIFRNKKKNISLVVPSVLGSKLESQELPVELSSAPATVAYSMEPYFVSVAQTDKRVSSSLAQSCFQTFSGVRTAMQFAEQGGRQLHVWYDAGLRRGEELIEPFRQLGMELTCRTQRNSLQLRFPGQSAERGASLDVASRVKVCIMRSWGSGRIPFFHFEDVCGSKLMRGTLLSSPTLVNVANGDDDEDKNTYRTIKSPRYSVFKADVHFPTLFANCIPGIFLDSSLHTSSRQQEPTSVIENLRSIKISNCLGISLRCQGFRVDVGWAVKSRSTPRFYLGMDGAD